MTEEWRIVHGHPYEVSNIGRVRRATDLVVGQGAVAYRAGHVLRGSRHSGGYRTVGPNLYIHRLVAGAFIPNPLGLPHVNHKNGDPADNRATNLEWVTQAENLRHAREELGRGAPPPLHCGTNQHDAKLDEDKIRAIRRVRRETRASIYHIAAAYGVSANTISRILNGKSWKHVPDDDAMPTTPPSAA